jgi:hypothetical protein
MKYEWKKSEKRLYLPNEIPELVTVTNQKFLTISGKGNPNNPDFSKRVEVLFSLSWAIKMLPKKGYNPVGYFDYVVYPLEGVWDLTEEGKQQNELKKEELVYTIMVRQPDFVTKEDVAVALEVVKKKISSELLDKVIFETMEDGLCVQMLHIGAFDDEPKSFELMKKYIHDNNLEIVTLKHREIYISDARKTEKSKLKTVLRYRVKYKS